MRSIPLFISSTFRDFDRERDVIIQQVIPNLNLHLRDHRAKVHHVDLRWGVGHDEADDDRRTRQAMQVCLERISASDTIFVGLIGDCVGSVPDEQLATRFLEDWNLPGEWRGHSITALECLHAARALGDTGHGAVVYFVRDIVGSPPPGFRDGGPAVEELRATLRGLPNTTTQDYELHYASPADEPDLSEFAEMVARALLPAILGRLEAGHANPADPYQLQYEDAVTRFRLCHVRRPVEVDAARLAAAGPVFISGEAGVGKSRVALAVALSKIDDGCKVVHYVAEWNAHAHHGPALAQRLGLSESVSTFKLTGALIEALDGDAVVIIDGIERLDDETWEAVLNTAGRHRPGLVLTMEANSSRADSLRTRCVETAQQSAVEVVVPLFDPAETLEYLRLDSQSRQKSLPEMARRAAAEERRSAQWLDLVVQQLDRLGRDDYANLHATRDALEVRLTQLVREMSDQDALVARVVQRCHERIAGTVGSRLLSCLALAYDGITWEEAGAGLGASDLEISMLLQLAAGVVAERPFDGVLYLPSPSLRALILRHVSGVNEQAVHGWLAAISLLARERSGPQVWHSLHVGNPLGVSVALESISAVPPGSRIDEDARNAFFGWLRRAHQSGRVDGGVLSALEPSDLAFARLVGWLNQAPGLLTAPERDRLAAELERIEPPLAADSSVVLVEAGRDLAHARRQINTDLGLDSVRPTRLPKHLLDLIHQRES